MILKYEDEEDLFFIDATMNGVTILPWSSLRTWKDEVYSWIIVRHLEIERDEYFLETMNDFVEQVNEKKYSLGNLIRAQTFVKTDDDDNKKI